MSSLHLSWAGRREDARGGGGQEEEEEEEEEESLRIGVHHANGVVWEAVSDAVEGSRRSAPALPVEAVLGVIQRVLEP